MSNETEAGTQTQDCSSDTIALRLKHELEMHPQKNGFPISEITLRSVEEQIKWATDPILRRAEELCALLARRTELETTGNSEVTGLRRDNTSASPSGKRHDSIPGPVLVHPLSPCTPSMSH